MKPLNISVVTAAYNMEDTVGETLRSVVSQKRANDQYIFIDGASKDKTFDIARSFSNDIDVMVSEPDQGQYHAIQKGFYHATGDIHAWINADDILMPWTFSVVREIFTRFPKVNWITGNPAFINTTSQLTRIHSKIPSYPRRFIANGWFQKHLGAYLQQESMFWRKDLWDDVGGLDTSYTLAADFDLWTRFAQHTDLIPIDIPLAAFRERPGQQRSSIAEHEYEAEIARICTNKPKPPRLWTFVADRGLVARNAARMIITAPSSAIAYDRRNRMWKMTTRRRSLAKSPFAVLLEELHMNRR